VVAHSFQMQHQPPSAVNDGEHQAQENFVLTDTVRRVAIRPLLVMLAVTFLASSALVATTTGALAAKPIPDFEFVQSSAHAVCASGATFLLDVEFSGAKGGWVFVEAEASPDGLDWQDVYFGDTPHRTKATETLTLSWRVTRSNWGDTTTFRLRIVDRKGEPIVDREGEEQSKWKTSEPVDCPAP
jgi:hypothetical protein